MQLVKEGRLGCILLWLTCKNQLVRNGLVRLAADKKAYEESLRREEKSQSKTKRIGMLFEVKKMKNSIEVYVLVGQKGKNNVSLLV
ncbi:hypothetical protein SADUNF_Sadunf05G0182300 [Salix dunnii]|uniref:Uncharacterized protein n=1 Tax=Salix dunnii TaxID=1413687 RepID=A0A835K6X4_9ROSI|nr:hypothetical protein SADUNF_Sadunf05G0182300 [Salix dunnii]